MCRANTLRYVLTGSGVVLFLVAICTGGFNEFRYPPYSMYFVAAGLLSVVALYMSLFARDQRPSPRQGFSMLLSALVPSTNAMVSIGSSLPLGIYTIYALHHSSPMVLAVAVPGVICFLMPIAYPAVAWGASRRRKFEGPAPSKILEVANSPESSAIVMDIACTDDVSSTS